LSADAPTPQARKRTLGERIALYVLLALLACVVLLALLVNAAQRAHDSNGMMRRPTRFNKSNAED
jgi:hypothetical protein